MSFVRLILVPFSILYGVITWVRNKLFDLKVLSTREFDIPVISVGNLSTGGTGKTPHIEYMMRLLGDDLKIAILSRGYKRKSKGFILAAPEHGMNELGDEAAQLKQNFPNAIVAVAEKRVYGIEKLLETEPVPRVILLDDAFQHRYVKPGVSILLTDFYQLFSEDFMLPSGTLREFKSGAKRADIILVTKSPKVISPFTKRRIKKQLKPTKRQHLFFSRIRHGKLIVMPGIEFNKPKSCKFSSILLFAGIANPYPLEIYLKEMCTDLRKMIFPDHHQFTLEDVKKLDEHFKSIFTKNKIIVTTQKDMMRLMLPHLMDAIKHLPICYVPIEVVINKEDREKFNQLILNYVEENRRNNSLH
ncbi:MAG: tetraacyldisaccharide 4'-kinase [Bacteroidales bacterium]|nr:tetraacyldisaccharide 4'-kinase [Bacteroidales bacterium]MCF8403739.1 tetraacyldisaccharide 4'-kinase [Bacteroidales bacterium]